jgi:hypothetical protein
MTHDYETTPSVTAQDLDSLVLEFQRLSSRLARAGLIKRTSSVRLAQGIQRARSEDADDRRSLLRLVGDILVSLEDGTLQDGVHVRRVEPGLVALHPRSVASALYRAGRFELTEAAFRRLFRLGARLFGDVVRGCSDRVVFGPRHDRRRSVLLDVAKAYDLIGLRPPSVMKRGPVAHEAA